MRCEDYPCCGHTDGLGCDWTYTEEARAYDQNHALCDHEAGFCDLEFFEEDEDCDPRNAYCREGDEPCLECREYWLDFHADGMEDQWLDGSYEE